MRAFFALELPDDARAAVEALQTHLIPSGADVAWVHPDRLHVTMRFLGDITEAQRQQLEAEAARIVGAFAPFQIRLSHPSAFPSADAPRVVWVGIGEGEKPLVQMASQLEQASVRAGLKPDERGFMAHVTIGRVRGPRGVRGLSKAMESAPWSPPPAFPAQAITLFESVLQRSGPVYTALARLSISSAT